MGTGLEVLMYAGYALMAAGFVYGLYMMGKAGGDVDNMDPSTLDDFQITKADEGSALPLVYGRRKVTGNIIWYGNLYTEEVIEEVDTGKDTENVVTGYNYYLDIWKTLGHADMTIVETYIQEELKEVEYTSMVFNGGSDGTYSTIPGEYSTALDGVCHVFYERMLLGENVQTVPTVHYVVERLMGPDNPILYKNMTDGINPAAIVWDLLIRGGAGTGEINLTSFNEAATYWYNKGYALNIVFTNRMKTRDAIKQTLEYVGAAFGQDEEGKFYLRALDENDSSVATMDFDEGELSGFNFDRTVWEKLYTDFVASFLDEDKEYTERTVKAYNPAVARIIGRRIEKSIKLQGFRTVELASKRIWEIMKEATYPFANVQTTVPMKYYALKLGDVVTINHSQYGISGAYFRVMKKTIKSIKDNSIALVLRQKTEDLYDSNWSTVGGGLWTNPDYTPVAAHKTLMWQLPYNHLTGHDPCYVCLVARKNTFETGYALYKSYNNTDYTPVKMGRTFSQYGTLDSDYPITYDIDEITGITYTPYQEDPAFDTITIEAAMQTPRLALINDELIGFATVTLNGDNSITLTDCIRGMFGTTIAAHTASDDIWIFSVEDSVLYQNKIDSTFYYKVAPFSLRGSVDIATVSGTLVTKQNIILPKPIFYVEDLGSYDRQVTVYFFDETGVGTTGETQGYYTGLPANGRLRYYFSTDSSTVYTATENPFTYNIGISSHTLYVQYEYNGVQTGYRSVASVADYNLPLWSSGREIPNATTGLVKLSYGMQNFIDFVDTDYDTLKTVYSYFNNLLDADMSSVADEDYIVFDSVSQKFVPVGYASFLNYGAGLDSLPLFEGEHGPYDDGSMTASSYQASYPPQHSWDGGDGTLYPQWIITDPGSEVFPDATESHWIQWDWTDHGGSRDLRGIRLYTRYNSTTDRWPSAVKVYGSNTGSFSGEEKLLYSGPLEDAENITPNTWTTWTAFDQTDNFDFYVHHRVVITDVYTYDPGGYYFAVDQWQFKEALTWEYATSFEVIYGYTYGLFSDIINDDGTEMTLYGIERSVPLEVDFYFEKVEETSVYFNFIGRYEGVASHNVKIYAYDWVADDWSALTSDTTDLPHATTEDLYSFLLTATNHISVDDEVKIKARVTSAGDENDTFVVDKVALSGPGVHPYYDGSKWDENISSSSFSFEEYGAIATTSYNYGHRVVVGGDLLEITTGSKIYFECICVDKVATDGVLIGVSRSDTNLSQFLGSESSDYAYRSNGQKSNNFYIQSYGTAYVDGDIIGVAVDWDAGKIWFAKNNVWQASGDPANGTNAAYTNLGTNSTSVRPAASCYRTNEEVSIQTRQSEMTYTAPTGFDYLVSS